MNLSKKCKDYDELNNVDKLQTLINELNDVCCTILMDNNYDLNYQDKIEKTLNRIRQLKRILM